jgi:uncharacterized protein (TIGR02265 family)
VSASPSQRLVFAHTVEALVERSGAAADPDMRAALRALGINPDSWLPAYPQAQWFEVIAAIAVWRFPRLTPAEAEFELGLLFIEGYANTFIGTALFAMLKVLPSRRVVDRLARSFRSGNNYTEVEILENVPCRARIRMNTVEPRAQMTRAILQRGLQRGGIEGLQAHLQSHQGSSAEYLLTW